MDVKKITILGAGSWGTTLAVLLAKKQMVGVNITLWEKFEDDFQSLIDNRENVKFLPGIKILESVEICNELQQAITDADIVVLAVPSHVVRGLVCSLEKLVRDLDKKFIVISVVKGIENETLFRVSEIVQDVLGDVKFVSLSGPTHAEEVAKELPSTIVAASVDEDSAVLVQALFATESFRVYTNNDLVGVELGGSLKNIIAIAAGISDGLGFGDNTKAALLTRGLAEITRLGTAMGANSETFAGLTGIGDLITTCISNFSRNRFVGQELGKGRKLDDILVEMTMVAEGVRTTKSVYELAKKYDVDMPITCQMYKVLFEGKGARQAAYDLMVREYKPE